MTVLLPTLAVAFAAFCVWLAVRIVNRRERWAMWTAVAIVLLWYPMSAGPASWAMRMNPPPAGSVHAVAYFSFFYPLAWLAEEIEPLGRVIYWYANLFG